MPRNAQIRLRLTDEEKAQIEARAKAQGQKPAEFVRDLALYGHRLKIRNTSGEMVERREACWEIAEGGKKRWWGLARGDEVYISERLAFVADDPESRLTRGDIRDKPYVEPTLAEKWLGAGR